MKIDEQLKVIDKITDKAIKQVEKEREGKRRNYFVEMLRYCELVISNVKKYLNQEEYGSKKINEQLKPRKPDPYTPTRRYGVMGLSLGSDLHDRLKNYAVKNNVKMAQIIKLL